MAESNIEYHFVDTVRCMLGRNSNCIMNGKLRLGPQCAKCGFNNNVYRKRLMAVKNGEFKSFENGTVGIVV